LKYQNQQYKDGQKEYKLKKDKRRNINLFTNSNNIFKITHMLIYMRLNNN